MIETGWCIRIGFELNDFVDPDPDSVPDPGSDSMGKKMKKKLHIIINLFQFYTGNEKVCCVSGSALDLNQCGSTNLV
jgi:hypothetical protein